MEETEQSPCLNIYLPVVVKEAWLWAIILWAYSGLGLGMAHCAGKVSSSYLKKPGIRPKPSLGRWFQIKYSYFSADQLIKWFGDKQKNEGGQQAQGDG